MTIARIIADRPPADIVTCDVGMSVADAIGMLSTKRIGAMPVLRDGLVAGIVSERDVVYCLAKSGGPSLDEPVQTIMTAPAMTVTPSTAIDDALTLMTRRRFRHFPVMDEDRLVGFISIGDLVKYKIGEVENEAAAMRDYIAAG